MLALLAHLPGLSEKMVFESGLKEERAREPCEDLKAEVSVLGLACLVLGSGLGACEKGVPFYQSRDGWRQMGGKETLGSVFDLLNVRCVLVLSRRS